MPVAHAHQVRIHEISRVERAIDTVNGQLSVDLIVKVEGEDRLLRNCNSTLGPSWSMGLLADPRSVGPAVFLGSPPTHHFPPEAGKRIAAQRRHNEDVAVQMLPRSGSVWCRQQVRMTYAVSPSVMRSNLRDHVRAACHRYTSWWPAEKCRGLRCQ